ncbi:polysaccharide biosynthesis protein [Desulfogranum japonicum]|uniref:polysaccharide biosynthesis protein n=1 Tax=Desulfogranum japonicum TaxID=231447 RepID=UPI0003F75286|nr:nucleoside-diphosphate sugar epimerase/dehydratase [Desulfogranum japonicum]
MNIQLVTSLRKNPKFWFIITVDIILLVIAYYLANVIRFADSILEYRNVVLINPLIPFLVFVKIIIFYLFGLYRGMWRYTSYSDIFNILKGTTVSAFIIVTILLYFNRFEGLSRSVFILDTLLTFLLVSGHRVAIRYFYQNVQGSNGFFTKFSKVSKKRLLIIGAGAYAEKVLREIKENNQLPYAVVGLVDDDHKKTGMKIHGIPVFGLISDLKEHIRRSKANEALIAIASLTGQDMQRIVTICQEADIPFKVLPGIGQIIDGKISVKSMRDISYSDLLGRTEVKLEQDVIGRYLTDQTVLVTGAGGSIGSELCRQILRFSPRRIILLDASEANLYTIQMELVHEYKFENISPILGKVQDLGLLEWLFLRHKPEVVFHAAAYKHVPLVENNPWQAIHNNVLGTQLLAETSIIHGVQRFVLVSTDKAVRPTNVMGASKRLTELIMMAYGKDNWNGQCSPIRSRLTHTVPLFDKKLHDHNTVFMAVRFGNVLGSSGSVIPLFKRQIELGGPVTVTHPEITRYFMSIEEAAQLILQAGAMGHGEEIFILKMGEPIKIANMARRLIKLAGKEPDTEIEIKYTGLREGEKLYEELITEGEGIVETHHEKIMVLRGNSMDCVNLFNGLEELFDKARRHDSYGIKMSLQQLIPEFTPCFLANDSLPEIQHSSCSRSEAPDTQSRCTTA